MLQASSSDSLYDVLETASLVQNEEFIKKVLDIVERDVKSFLNDPTRKNLLKNSFITLLKTAAKQGHDSIVEYLCKKCLECSDPNIHEIYQEVFKDNEIIEQIEEQLLKNIDSAGDRRKEKKQKILALVKSTALNLTSPEISKEDLLRAAEFANISYYVGDGNHNNNNFAKLEERGYKTLAQFEKEGYTAIQFLLDNPSWQAGYIFIKDDNIIITYRGTDSASDIKKDLEIQLRQVEFLPENCNLHSGFYDRFKGSWESIYEILRGYANDRGVGIEELKITVTGHSMGGAVANIAALYLKLEEKVKNLRVVTIAAPRAANETAAELYNSLLWKETVRVDNRSDPVTMVPLGCMGYKYVGRRLRVGLGAMNGHEIENYINLIRKTNPEDFKFDDNASLFKYVSQTAKSLYNIILGNFGNLQNSEEGYFERIKDKHKDASFFKIMEKYNPSEVEYSENSEQSLESLVILNKVNETLVDGEGVSTNEHVEGMAETVNREQNASNGLVTESDPEVLPTVHNNPNNIFVTIGNIETPTLEQGNDTQVTKQPSDIQVDSAHESIQNELEKQNTQLAEKKKELDDANKKVSQLEQDIANQLTERGKELNVANEKASQLQEDLKQAKQKIDDLTAQVTQLEKLQKELDTKIKEFQDTKAQLEQEHDSTKQNLTNKTSEVTRLTEELKGTKAQLTEREEELNVANEKVSKLEQEKSKQQASIDNLTNISREKSQLEEKLNSVEQKLEKTESENKRTKAQLEQELSKAKQDLAKITKELKSKETNLEDSKKELDNVNEKGLKLEQEISNQQINVGNLTAQVTQLTNEKSQLEKKLNSEVTTRTEEKDQLVSKGVLNKLCQTEKKVIN